MKMNDLTLACPACGSNYLHHRTVTIYSRKGEDQDGIKTIVNSQPDDYAPNTIVEICDEDDMPGRRDGLVITFYCESCPSRVFKLLICQHKGETQFCWLNIDSKVLLTEG